MLRGMARLLTGGDVIPAVIAILVGVTVGALITASLEPGTGRTIGAGLVTLLVVGVVLQRGMGLYRRYRQLSEGKCPYVLCHGVVQQSELVGENEVVCPTCKKRWPKLASIQYRATARM